MAEEGCFLQCICYLALQASGVGCRRAGVQAHPQKFWFVENPWKPGQNPRKSRKIFAKFPEIWANSENTGKNVWF